MLYLVVVLAGQWTCNSQVTGSSPGGTPLRSGLGQSTYTCVPLITKQYNFVLAKGWSHWLGK